MVRDCLSATHADSTNQRIRRHVAQLLHLHSTEILLGGPAAGIFPILQEAQFLRAVHALLYTAGRGGAVACPSEVDAFVSAIDLIHLDNRLPWPGVRSVFAFQQILLGLKRKHIVTPKTSHHC